MFEVYAIIATVLLPTGIISFIYFIYHLKSSTRNPFLWTLVFESITTVLLGVFYLYSAIILSRTSVTNEVSLVNNIDDFAIIINDTAYEEIEVPTFYGENAEPSDQNNEVEDTRNNKNQGTPSDFLQKYQNLVQTSIRKKLQNSTREERSLYQRMLNYARNMKEEVMTDILENKSCFLRNFFYQALLVYSFVTSAISLLNTCQICQQCSKETPRNTTVETPKPDNPSASFGEKVSDDVSDNSSQNAAPVGPLFDDDSIGSSTPNLDVFSVKHSSQTQLTPQKTTEPCSGQALNAPQDQPILTAGKCATILVMPILLVVILYFLMKNSFDIKVTDNDSLQLFNFLPNFNNTNSNIQTSNFVKHFNDEENENSSQHREINDVLRNVYTVINKFQEDYRNTKMPTVTGQYLYKSRAYNATNSTEDCSGNQTTLKTFDFAVFVLLFFAVIFYTKLTEVNLPKTGSSQNINKCILAFLMLWSPGIIDMVVSRFLTSRQPNLVSTLLLLLGNMEKLYSTKINVNAFKMYGRRLAFVNPLQK